MLFATVVFFIGSLLCGAAPNLWSLVVARLVAGLGGGGINTLTTVIISDLVSLRDRGKYQGYGNMAYGVSVTNWSRPMHGGCCSICVCCGTPIFC